MNKIHLALPILSLLLIWGCKAQKEVAWSPVGNWSYVVSNTPNGNVEGVLNLSKEGDVYKGTMSTNEGSISLKDVSVVDNQLNAHFFYQGYRLKVKGKFEGESLNGAVSMGSDSFPLKASRK